MLKSVAAQKLFPIGIAGSLAILSLLSIWKIPQWQIQPIQQQIDALQTSKQPVDPKEIAALEKSKLDAENAARTVLVQGAGGLFAAAAAHIAWRNLKTTQEKQVAERFSKAVEQLGSENIHVRLGGIYALEQIAKDAEEKYYWQVMETLTAYIRVNSPASLNSTSSENIPKLPIDIQSVMTVLGHRKEVDQNSNPITLLNLTNTDLRGLELPIYANLKNINFSGSDIQQSKLKGVQLQNSLFTKANLQYVFLAGANLQKAVLSYANLRGAMLSGADLQEASCGQADFREAFLWEADFKGANLGASQLQGANLTQAKFKESSLVQTNFEFSILEGASFEKAVLDYAQLQDAVGLQMEQIEQALSCKDAGLPSYLEKFWNKENIIFEKEKIQPEE
jgi:hypothetical protein